LLSCCLCNGILIAFLLRGETVLGEIAVPVKAAAGGILTLILWLLLISTVPRPARQVQVETPPPPGGQPSSEGVVQMLAALQREGRLIDFLQEDLSQYEDGQIGAAVRPIHAGCQEVLKEHMEIRPVLEEKEGTQVTVPPGFDPRVIRLSGNVTGNPPFRGILRHRGWRVERIRLSQLVDQKNHWILTPAEVEVE
jgi:hypothetical protein